MKLCIEVRSFTINEFSQSAFNSSIRREGEEINYYHSLSNKERIMFIDTNPIQNRNIKNMKKLLNLQ